MTAYFQAQKSSEAELTEFSKEISETRAKNFTCVDRPENHPCRDIHEFLLVEELEELES